jgi:hypothetical protein
MIKNVIDQRVMGTAVIGRFAQVTVTGELAQSLDDFKVVHRLLEDSASSAEQACRMRDAALDEVGEADALLDHSVISLAAKMAGAELGPRNNPFAKFASVSPSQLVGLAYLNEIAAVRDLAARVTIASPPEDVSRKIGECLQRAAEVEHALAGISGPQAEFDRRRGERDAAAEAWSKAFAKLRLRAQLAFENDENTFKALFAAPEKVQRPANRRGKNGAPEEKPQEEPKDTDPVVPE